MAKKPAEYVREIIVRDPDADARPYIAMGDDDPMWMVAAASAAMSSLHRAAGRVLERDMGVRPTITVRPGVEMTIMTRQRVEVPDA